MNSMPKERRKAARYMVNLDIDIALEDGTILPVRTYDISLNGLQFSCDSLVANEIEPRGVQKHFRNRLKLKVITRFPTDDREKFYASCTLVAARRLSQDEYLLSLDFQDFEKNSGKVLQNFINKLALDELG